MNGFIVRWTADGYCGEFRYLVVAKNLIEAKELWEEFASCNNILRYSWEKAKKSMKYHHGGYITWKDNGNTNLEPGCYAMEFDRWNTKSDHLWD